MDYEQIPDTPVGKRFKWVLKKLVNEAAVDPTEGELRAQFNDGFLTAVPPSMMASVRQQLLAMMTPFELEGFEGSPTSFNAVAIVANPNGEKFRATIEVEQGPPHLISGLLFQPAFDLRGEPVARSWDELDVKLSELAAKVGFLAAEIVDGQCVPLHSFNEDRQLAIGSAFKLFVLGEMANQISAGDLAWDTEVAIEERLKSIPSGVMQNEKTGTNVSVKDFAEKMISISDNTATDHLLFRLGRINVEKYQLVMGHSNASLNIPFLSTREMAILKIRELSPERVEAFIGSNAEGRRSILEGEVAQGALPKVEDDGGWDKPRWIESIEWFASATDLCSAMAHLKVQMEKPGLEPLTKVLSINPGRPFDRYAWTYIGYKGGGEPGVLNFTWLLRRLDERWFAMSFGLNDPEKLIPEMLLAPLAFAAAALLVLHRKKSKAPRRSRASKKS